MQSLTVPPGSGTVRLDVFLAHHEPRCTRRRAQRVIAAAEVRINGRWARKGQTVMDGDVVEVPDELYEPATLQPNAQLVVPVLYEDAAVIAVDKPPGMPSHALRADETETLANFLLARYPETAAVGRSDREPGIVHRLDTDTSGVLLVARTPTAYAHLRAQFAAHRVLKEYQALVAGDVVTPGQLRTPIAHDPRNRRRMQVASDSSRRRARAACTDYRPIERFGHCTLLGVQITTGVRHQIRVHLASIGHPVVGDQLYGWTPAAASAQRQLLHAYRIVFAHPLSGKPTEVTSPLAPDFAALVAELRRAQRGVAGRHHRARDR